MALDVAQRSGALRTLLKPVYRDQLLATIHELFPDWQPPPEEAVGDPS